VLAALVAASWRRSLGCSGRATAARTDSEHASKETARRRRDDRRMRYLAVLVGTLATLVLVLPH
jgi:hypothetical protein